MDNKNPNQNGEPENQDDSIQSLGGKARAEKLTAEQRREIAIAAAEARWSREAIDRGDVRIPKATHPGILKIGTIEIPCAVLEGGIRVITQRGMFVALGMNKNPTKGQTAIANRPAFVGAENLNPFISEDLKRSWNPIPFRLAKGSGGYRGNIAFGYDAKVLPLVCQVYLDALEARDPKTGKSVLHARQEHIAKAAKILHRGFAIVGIVALVDEATGYQDVRDRLALQEILKHYINGKLYEWTLTFPTEFFKGICRLKNWPWNNGKMPSVTGKYINDLIYSRLADGVLEQLKRLNPPTEKGYKKYNDHQFLTRDIGHPALSRMVFEHIGIQSALDDGEWDKYRRIVDRRYQKVNATIALPLND